MPQKVPHTVHILEGKATLYKRPTTPIWFVRYKADGKWLRSTTKQADLKDAKLAAVDIVTNAWFRVRNDLPIVNKRFKHVANLAIKRMQDLLDNGQGKVTYRHYIQAINKYLIPFLAQHNIDKIDYALLNRFSTWRAEQMKTTPSQSAINTHNSALNRVFDEALIRGFITKSQVPHLENKGLTSERRDDFTVEEYKKLYQYMRKWVKEAREGNEKVVRDLLRDYVLILANTGMRAGTEAMNLKWQHITIVKQDGQEYLTLNIKGKTKKMRAIQVPHRVAVYLQRIQMRDEELKHMSFYELIEASVDKYVFRVNGKDMTSNFGKIFKRLLEAAGLLVDRRSGKDRTLYCMRHYYATLMITKGRVTTAHLAKYMGTSELMIEKHYGHLNLQRLADKFVGSGSLNEVLGIVN
jgi:integrase